MMLFVAALCTLICINNASMASTGACYVSVTIVELEGSFPRFNTNNRRYVRCYSFTTKEECLKLAQDNKEEYHAIDARFLDWQQGKKCEKTIFE